MKNKKFFLTILLFILIFANKCVFASYADYTEEDAERDKQQMIQEHQEQFDSTKSDNNYLKDLIITGGTISPNFDRQIIDYSVKIENNIKEINITANPEDNKATVSGTGKIDISSASECKIEVAAESGTTRTYYIKIIKTNEENHDEKSENVTDQSENKISEDNSENIDIVNKNYNTIIENEKSNNIQNNNFKTYIFIGIGVAVLFIIIVLSKLNKKKSKH